MAAPAFADDVPVLNLKDRISIKEVNRGITETENLTKRKKVFYFGFDQRLGPQEDAQQYLPFLNYLERSTGYELKLRFTPKNSTIIDELGTGRVHFAAIGSMALLQVQAKYGATNLVQGVNSLGKTAYQSIIVVRPESPLKNVAELKGKRFAFGDVSSTQGHLIPRIVLAEHDIALKDLGAFEYTGSRRNCVNAVLKDAFDACGMQDTLAKVMADKGLVRFLHVSRYFPSSGIAANKDIAPQVVEKIKHSLLDFEPLSRDREGMHNWDRTEMPKGFQAVDPAGYQSLRSSLVRLGILK